MVKKMNVAGLLLDDYTVREAIMQVEMSLESKGFYLIEEITTEMLFMAEKQEKLKEVINHLDLAVISESEILSAMNMNTMQRQHEIDEHVFFHEFLKRMERNHKTIFVLGERLEEIQKMKEAILKDYSRLLILGEAALLDYNSETDGIVNEINSATPDVILSILPSPAQEAFLYENRAKLSTRIWYGVGKNYYNIKKNSGIRKFLSHTAKSHMLKKHVNLYQKQEEARENAKI